MDGIQAEGIRRLMASSAAYVIGVDEVGLGAWAGPLTVAGVVLPKGWGHPDVKDSKKFGGGHGGKKSSAHEKRKRVLHTIIRPAEEFELVRHQPTDEVDTKGVHRALDETVESIVRSCVEFYPDSVVVIDGNRECSFDFLDRENLIVLPKADTMVQAVSAASILAKVTRDSIMLEYHKTFPQYGFNRHVGYGTPEHKNAIEKYGLCEFHRQSYRPIKRLKKKGGAGGN